MKMINLMLLASISATFLFTACSSNMPDDYYYTNPYDSMGNNINKTADPYDRMGNNINKTADPYNDYNYNYDKYDSKVQYNNDRIIDPNYSGSLSNNIYNNNVLDKNNVEIYDTQNERIIVTTKVPSNIDKNNVEIYDTQNERIIATTKVPSNIDKNNVEIYDVQNKNITKSKKIQGSINKDYSTLDKEILIDNTKTLNKTMNDNSVLTDDTTKSITSRQSLDKTYSNNNY